MDDSFLLFGANGTPFISPEACLIELTLSASTLPTDALFTLFLADASQQFYHKLRGDSKFLTL